MESHVPSFPTFEAAGVRGSHVTTDVHFDYYGGDTICLLLTSASGEHLLVDGGSGLFRFNPVINDDAEITVFVSHPHFDHIQGFFFLDTFYKKEKKNYSTLFGGNAARAFAFICPPLLSDLSR